MASKLWCICNLQIELILATLAPAVKQLPKLQVEIHLWGYEFSLSCYYSHRVLDIIFVGIN